jgi:hypothetical protein
MACSSGGRPARRRVGRALHQPEECATYLFHQTRDTTEAHDCIQVVSIEGVENGLERFSLSGLLLRHLFSSVIVKRRHACAPAHFNVEVDSSSRLLFNHLIRPRQQ